MEETGLAAVAKFVMRNRDTLGCLRVRDGLLTLERMHFADEIRPVAEVAPEKTKVEKGELDMAKRLVGEFQGAFEPERFDDTYRDKLCEIIRAKQRGETIKAAPVEEAAAPTDLMAALRESVEAARGRLDGGRRGREELDELSKDELYTLAKNADIPGRSDMSKEQLVEALRAAG